MRFLSLGKQIFHSRRAYFPTQRKNTRCLKDRSQQLQLLYLLHRSEIPNTSMLYNIFSKNTNSPLSLPPPDEHQTGFQNNTTASFSCICSFFAWSWMGRILKEQKGSTKERYFFCYWKQKLLTFQHLVCTINRTSTVLWVTVSTSVCYALWTI